MVSLTGRLARCCIVEMQRSSIIHYASRLRGGRHLVATSSAVMAGTMWAIVGKDLTIAEQNASSLPQVWTAATDPASGRTYYYNTETQQTRWTMPVRSEDRLPVAVKSDSLHPQPSARSLDSLVMRAQNLRFRGEAKEGTTEPLIEIWSSTQQRDADGEAAVRELAAALRASGKKFTDTVFPAHDAWSNQGVGVEWKRPEEFAASGRKPVVFSDGASPEDITQGALGNCYFLAALSSCAAAEGGKLIEDLIIEDGSDVGLYGVKFFVNGSWVTVVVDDLFPVVPKLQVRRTENEVRLTETGEWTPLFAHSDPHDGSPRQEMELWVMIAEKAWAKLHGGYMNTIGGTSGDALHYLCGGRVDALGFHHDTESSWLKLKTLVQEGKRSPQRQKIMCCSVDPILASKKFDLFDTNKMLRSCGLVPQHAYSVLDAIEFPDDVRLVQLRNPLGKIEYTGPWNDDDPRWTSALRALTRRPDQTDSDDGSFFMAMEDFAKYFGEITVCDPWELVKQDNTGDGVADTVNVTSVRLDNCWTAAECTVPPSEQEQELSITVYHRDVRGLAHCEDQDWDLSDESDAERRAIEIREDLNKVECEAFVKTTEFFGSVTTRRVRKISIWEPVDGRWCRGPEIPIPVFERFGHGTVTLPAGESKFTLWSAFKRLPTGRIKSEPVWVSVATAGRCEMQVHKHESRMLSHHTSSLGLGVLQSKKNRLACAQAITEQCGEAAVKAYKKCKSGTHTQACSKAIHEHIRCMQSPLNQAQVLCGSAMKKYADCLEMMSNATGGGLQDTLEKSHGVTDDTGLKEAASHCSRHRKTFDECLAKHGLILFR